MFDLDQLQSIMDGINRNAHEVFPVAISITQVQFRGHGVWVAYTQNGRHHEMTVPVDTNASVDSQLIYNVQVAIIRAIQSVMGR